jgi:hypothetical protein
MGTIGFWYDFGNGEEDVEEEDDKEIGISWVWDDEDSRTFILIKTKPINISIYCTDK